MTTFRKILITTAAALTLFGAAAPAPAGLFSSADPYEGADPFVRGEMQRIEHQAEARRLMEDRAIAEASPYGIQILKERVADAEKALATTKENQKVANKYAAETAKAVALAKDQAKTEAAAKAEQWAERVDQ